MLKILMPPVAKWRISGGPWRTDGIYPTGYCITLPEGLRAGDHLEVAWYADDPVPCVTYGVIDLQPGDTISLPSSAAASEI